MPPSRPPGRSTPSRPPHPATRRRHGRWAWAALASLAGLWWALRSAPPAWIDDVWAHRYLPPLSHATAALADALPWSLTLLGAVALLAGVVALALAGPGGSRSARLAWAAVPLLALGPAFELAWGLGYRRTPLETRLGLPTAAPTADAAWGALDHLLAVAIASAPSDERRVALDAPWSTAAVAAGSACVASADAHASGRTAALRLPSGVRRLPAGFLLQGGFVGVQLPWWREPHVDGGLPPAAALATALHEFAHAAGWAREAETDALAVLAGLACPDPEVRFAAALHGLLRVRSELGRAVHEDEGWRAVLAARWATLPPAAGAAWAATSAAIARHRSAPVERVATAAYDTYLRSQGVTAGMADYDRAGVVLVAALAGCAADRSAPWCAPP